jgi:hypothetical protein
MMHVEVKGAIMATDARVKAEQGNAEKALIEALGEEEATKLIANRTKRDGDKAHITLAGPQDGKKAVDHVATERGVSKGEAQRVIPTLPLEGNWRAKGIGRAESGGKIAYFVVVDWPGGREFRESLGLDPSGQDFHITVGFGDSGDVHGVPKNRVLSPSELKKEASMTTLRSKIIRLAHAQPSLRPHLLPLLTRTAAVERVEGTPLSPVRLYWPNGRMRPMPGDNVYVVVPGLYGTAVVRGVAIKYGDSVRIKAQGKSHPASTRWIVENDPKVKAEESLKRLEKEQAAKDKQRVISEAQEAVAAYAKKKRLRPVPSLRDLSVGDKIYRISSEGQYGDGDPQKVHATMGVVTAIEGGTFYYENEHGSEVAGGDPAAWWR